jgi:hypothetical protein
MRGTCPLQYGGICAPTAPATWGGQAGLPCYRMWCVSNRGTQPVRKAARVTWVRAVTSDHLPPADVPTLSILARRKLFLHCPINPPTHICFNTYIAKPVEVLSSNLGQKHRLYWLRFVMVLLGPQKQIPEQCLEVGHDHFIQHLFKFFIL